MKIGLLGGSFDPPHAGHVHITKQALRRFGLDRVWWLVSPGNPLKADGPAPVEQRMSAARKIMQHPRVEITDIETRLGTRYTADTLAAVLARYPDADFVWLMGADNMVHFHKWQRWNWIMENVPVGVTSRPGEFVKASRSVMAIKYSFARVPVAGSGSLARRPAPAWCLLDGPTLDVSSSDIRAGGGWPR